MHYATATTIDGRATVTVDGKTYKHVGVHFRGQLAAGVDLAEDGIGHRRAGLGAALVGHHDRVGGLRRAQAERPARDQRHDGADQTNYQRQHRERDLPIVLLPLLEQHGMDVSFDVIYSDYRLA